MKKQFFLLFCFVIIGAISFGQKHIKAWGVIGENIEPRHDRIAGKDIYLQMRDERSLTNENWQRISDEFCKTLAATYPKARFFNVSEQELTNIGITDAVILRVAVLDCQVYFKNAKWYAKTTFDISLHHGGATNDRIFSQEIIKGNLLGNSTAMVIHMKAYNTAMDELIAYLDEMFSR